MEKEYIPKNHSVSAFSPFGVVLGNKICIEDIHDESVTCLKENTFYFL